MLKYFLKKNHLFKDLYKNDECYIFGNGASIKKYNLKNFSKKKTMVCGWLYLHKDFNYLNTVCDFEIHPGVFFYLWKNEYKKTYEINKILKFFNETKRISEKIPFFTSLINFPFIFYKKKIYYLYHFGYKEINYNFIDPTSTFSLLKGSMYTMIGLAKFMGFKKIYLVGMDYLFDGSNYGHFYEKNFENDNNQKNLIDKIFFDYFNKIMSITVICSKKNTCSSLNSVKYEEFFKEDEKNFDNKDLVSIENLIKLDKLGLNYKIF
jgi:hypothetical protein